MIIGIVGGMGSYATVSFFKRIVDAFPGEKEWDRPRILIDNYCTIPSRVRAVLYKERIRELVSGIKDSIENLMRVGADKIIIGCNTAHVFLPDVIELLPEANSKIIDLIEMAAMRSNEKHCKHVRLIASEGTYLSDIYPKYFDKYSIEVSNSKKEELIRELMEDVKQNKITDSSLSKFSDLIKTENGGVDGVILGCTELPVLYSQLPGSDPYHDMIIDPLECAIIKLCNDFREENHQGENS